MHLIETKTYHRSDSGLIQPQTTHSHVIRYKKGNKTTPDRPLKRHYADEGGLDRIENAPLSKRASYPDLVEIAFRAFQKSLYFHGTSKSYVASILKDGFKVEKKRSGSSDILRKGFGLYDSDTKSYLYMMSLPSAVKYAKNHSRPAILGMFVPSNVDLKTDPNGHASDEMRTRESIPSNCIFSDSELSVERTRSILDCLEHIRLDRTSLERLTSRVNCYIRRQFDQLPALMRSVPSFIEDEKTRDKETWDLMAKYGIGSDFKPGDTFSIPLD